MSNEFKYKGYLGSCEASIEDGCLHGRILFIDDLISYEGNTVPKLERSFKIAVDAYIDYCARTGMPANKPYSGSFNVRIGSDLHKAAVQCASRNGTKLNEFVKKAIEKEVAQTASPQEVVRHEIVVNHVTTHEQRTVELPYAVKEPSWQQNQEPQRKPH
ncbi:MAG: type II toxin-antitoxin system HicB family antitoxin [Gallionella sp.]